MKATLFFSLLALAASAQAAVDCKFNGRPVVVTEAFSDYHYSGAGKRDANGNLSMFRLLTLDESDGGPNSVELKTTDVTRPGTYALSMAAGWQSLVDVQGETQRVTGGSFTLTRFQMQGSTGRAAGSVSFTTAKVSGSCSFDIEVVGVGSPAAPR